MQLMLVTYNTIDLLISNPILIFLFTLTLIQNVGRYKVIYLRRDNGDMIHNYRNEKTKLDF